MATLNAEIKLRMLLSQAGIKNLHGQPVQRDPNRLAALCEEARFYLTQCGLSRLDGDKDGVPCEAVCRSGGEWVGGGANAAHHRPPKRWRVSAVRVNALC